MVRSLSSTVEFFALRDPKAHTIPKASKLYSPEHILRQLTIWSPLRTTTDVALALWAWSIRPWPGVVLSLCQWREETWRCHEFWVPKFTDDMGMDQYLYIPFLGGWTSIYQLFWCSPGVQGFDTLPYFETFEHILQHLAAFSSSGAGDVLPGSGPCHRECALIWCVVHPVRLEEGEFWWLMRRFC